MSAELVINPRGEVLLGGLPLHPAQGRRAAAEVELEEFLASLDQPPEVLVLAGAGLGWHVAAAKKLARAAMLLVFEPDAHRRALLSCLGPFLPEQEIITSEERLVEELGRLLVYGGRRRAAVFAPPAYQRAAPEVGERARELVVQAHRRRECDLLTRRTRRQMWWHNLRQNFQHLLKYPDLTLLAGALEGAPAIVVGAGPSLDQTLPELAARAGSHLMLAAASALGPLARHGLRPQVAVALEGKDESRQFAGADPGRTVLAAATAGHPYHFTRWPGQIGLFHLQPWLSALTGQGSPLANGGHATSAAFALAVLWGCDPIILVGQDLAYTGGRIHASGRPGGEDEDRPELAQVPAIGGGLVETSAIMAGYLDWYQEAAGYLRRKDPSRRIINATAAGARLPGFDHLTLAEALAGLGEPPLHFEQVVEAWPRLPRPPAGQLANRLSLARAEVRQTLERLEEDGWEAARHDLPQVSAAAAALEDLPREARAAQAREALAGMADLLRDLAEGLHA
ncbi:MAG: DUF115 domain-containing protein [Deltaproteobacteria bacterium]|nr:DUF115 domain-containing protein [Deltaproteobacteria bacterium]